STLYCSRSCLLYLPPSPSFSSTCSSASWRGGRSGSRTCILVLARSWFCSRRTVSGDSSKSDSASSVAKPATSTRRKRLTSIFDCSGVSTGTSTKVAQPAPSRAGSRRSLRLLAVLAVALVIGLAEQLVDLQDLQF